MDPINRILFVRDTIGKMFPRAVIFEGVPGELKSPYSLFFRDGETLIWAEVKLEPFRKDQISDYLFKAQKIQTFSRSEIQGILVAPQFEAGVHELLHLIRFPVRIFRYRGALSLAENGDRYGAPEKIIHASNRLSREELREFIQLELEVAVNQYK